MKNQIKYLFAAALLFITITACGSDTNNAVSAQAETPVESELEECYES